MLITLSPVTGEDFDIDESNIFWAEQDGDNVRVFHKHPATEVMQETLVDDTIDELNNTSVAAGGTLFGTQIYPLYDSEFDTDTSLVVDVLMNQVYVSKVWDTNPCKVNYIRGTHSINEIYFHAGDKTSFLADYNGDFSPSA